MRAFFRRWERPSDGVQRRLRWVPRQRRAPLAQQRGKHCPRVAVRDVGGRVKLQRVLPAVDVGGGASSLHRLGGRRHGGAPATRDGGNTTIHAAPSEVPARHVPRGRVAEFCGDARRQQRGGRGAVAPHAVEALERRADARGARDEGFACVEVFERRLRPRRVEREERRRRVAGRLWHHHSRLTRHRCVSRGPNEAVVRRRHRARNRRQPVHTRRNGGECGDIAADAVRRAPRQGHVVAHARDRHRLSTALRKHVHHGPRHRRRGHGARLKHSELIRGGHGAVAVDRRHREAGVERAVGDVRAQGGADPAERRRGERGLLSSHQRRRFREAQRDAP
mmetsp:Transcript_9801/g.30248  ORF Transcript_9801/g.30248 Transcript_9801/m.30248 type:complete len:336 (-) Transcript_9801:236-1243(-)